ncbi:SA1362 family protein [Alteribacter keqinensis]|uniref:Uncharacterized protein n=1 Tax=Alteribacter keqinensis TaxID=2483800 RepID=A0A3M7TX24_9BACI|nr:SA1362 family protein [Alteribacter keqinensis]RNA68965.1 hypothetical protein EBO34_03115 [Alteribacter keqinensis]
MLRQSFHPLLLVMFGLAILGIGSRLVTDPAGFFVGIFVTIGIVTLLFLLFRHVIMPRLSGSGYGRQYAATAHKAQPSPGTSSLKAAKSRKVKQEKKRSQRPLIKRQSDVQLRVIEGKKNKSKKKNRALF